MRHTLFATLGIALLISGCGAPPRRHTNLNFSRYHDPEFLWAGVSRVLFLPLFNETDHPRAGVEVTDAVSAELQRMGLFEVVTAPPGRYDHLPKLLREGGRFNEAELVDLARCFRADVILMGTVTQYRPYQRPRVGLVLQAVSPDTGKVIASVDGLWDSTSYEVADRARRFYARQQSCLDKVCDCAIGTIDTSYAADLVLDSPLLFSRFVAFEATLALVQQLVPRQGLPPADPEHSAHYRPKPNFANPFSCPPGRPAPSKDIRREKLPAPRPSDQPPAVQAPQSGSQPPEGDPPR